MSDLNRVPTFRYPPVGRCIYCGCDDQPLSDEHPVPLGLGGHLVLQKASCAKCANETHRYEGAALRSTLGNLRMRYGFPTRRKKERPTHIEIGTIDEQGRSGRARVPVTEYPVGAFIPTYGRAGIFLGAPPHLDVLEHLPAGYASDDISAFQKKYNWDGAVTLRWMPIQYGKTIIKMCYAYAVATIGVGSFEPICLDQILNKTDNISYIFGQNGKNPVVKGTSKVWDIKLHYLIKANSQILLIAQCSIFPGLGTPIYEVVLGTVHREHHIAILNDKLADDSLVEITRSFG